MTELAPWFATLRKKHRLTPSAMAERFGVSAAKLQQWEKGKAHPTAAELERVTRLFGPPPVEGAPKNGADRKARPSSDNLDDRASAAILGFEEKLWAAADKLRGSMDAAEYKHVVLGLVFLKYISDAFEERRSELVKEKEADPEDRDEYEGANVFWVPTEARWSTLQAKAKQADIGVRIDKAMEGIEEENPALKGTLPKEYARPQLDKTRLGELIDLMSGVSLLESDSSSKDILGRVYEYFLQKFASAEGRGGGEFYTPQAVVRVLVDVLEPFMGRIYDPCCGSGGMFVQSEKFVEAHGGRIGDIAVYGQEWNATTWRLCKMNLAIRGIEANLGQQWADTFTNDLHKGLKADFILANPPFNISDWGGEKLRDDPRWKFGAPPVGNANFAWLQHIVSKLGPDGVAGVILANGSMSSQQSGEGDIRKAMVLGKVIDCLVALPSQLFYTTQIAACLWFLARNKSDRRFRRRVDEVLFIDARRLGVMADRTHRVLTDEEIQRIARVYHAWRGEKDAGNYADVPGFSKSATLAEIEAHGFVLTPGRYVGAEEAEEDDESFEVKMPRLAATLEEQFAEGTKLEEMIRRNLRELGVAK
jgi:type I restriction enzyme M protein